VANQVPVCWNLNLNWTLLCKHMYTVDHMYTQFCLAQNLTWTRPSETQLLHKLGVSALATYVLSETKDYI